MFISYRKKFTTLYLHKEILYTMGVLIAVPFLKFSFIPITLKITYKLKFS